MTKGKETLTVKTPEEWVKSIKSGVITDEILDAVLYSVNKRAKNWRDKELEYKEQARTGYCQYYRYGDAEKAEQEEKRMYWYKERCLSLLSPICVHREFSRYRRERVHDYEERFSQELLKHVFSGDIAWWNTYLDYITDKEVFFFDYETEEPEFRYYLFYAVGDHTYHTPITEEWAKERDLPVHNIGILETKGCDTQNLVSMQFVRKVYQLIESHAYTYMPKEPVYPEETTDSGLYYHAYLSDSPRMFREKIASILEPEVRRRLGQEQVIPSELTDDEKHDMRKKAKKKIWKQMKKRTCKLSFGMCVQNKEYLKLDLSDEDLDRIKEFGREDGYTLDICVQAVLSGNNTFCQKYRRLSATREAARQYYEKNSETWKQEAIENWQEKPRKRKNHKKIVENV